MARIDLFSLAKANDDRLASEVGARLKAAEPTHADKVAKFHKMVLDRAGVSINMKPFKLLFVLEHGRYRTIYEIAAERAATSGKDIEDELRAMQGRYYEPRVFFDRAFEDGEKIVYGALNIGGPGAWEYGIFCGVLGDASVQSLRTALVPGNSLERYVSRGPPPGLDQATLSREVGSWRARADVAAPKHWDDIATVPEHEWNAMVCSKERFIEVLFASAVDVGMFAEIRMDRKEVERMADLAFDDMMGTLPKEDRAELHAYQRCMDKLVDLGLGDRVKEG